VVRLQAVNRPVRWLASHPGAQLAIGAVVVVVAFPGTPAGAIARWIACGALGVAAALAWPHAPNALRRPPPALATAIVLALVAAAGIAAFWDTLTISPDWQMGDWGPQHAVLAHIMPAMPGLHVPVWNHAIGTGDAPLELYPAATYLVTGHLAWLLGLQHDLPLAFMIVAVCVHVGLAVLTTAMAMRVAPRPIALVVGLLFLCDAGAITQGGTSGLFHWGILHSAFAHVFSLIATLGVLAALERPRLGASLAIWLGTAAAMASHPAASLVLAASVLALAAVAVLATDVPPRRALAAIGHLALGAALGAAVWIPMGERIYLYGQHFSNELFAPDRVLQLVLAASVPFTSYPALISAGYLGIAVGPFTRRANVIFIAVVALAMLLGLCDAPYRALGLAASPGVARLGAVRMMLLARPFVYAMGAFAAALVLRGVRGAWARAARRERLIAAALIGVIAGALAGALPGFWDGETDRAALDSNQIAPAPADRVQLERWARAQMKTLGPGHFARALFEENTHEYMHLTAETGLPALEVNWIPDVLLRERIEDTTAPSLRRFDVRWAIGVGKSPALGDPATEITIGRYHIREIAGWDGRFARVELGAGQVVTRRLDDRAVEIELTGTTEPALVALGTGYYPRWRARASDGTALPVYAYPSIPGGKLHVVAAWVKPGRTTFTPDGPLPSDGDGRWLTRIAALLALAGIALWSRARWRVRFLRRLARVRARACAFGARRAALAVPVGLGVLVAVGIHAERAPAKALAVGSGARPLAMVEARVPNGTWQTCDYSALTGDYSCDGLATVRDGMATVVDDAPPSWPFTTPAVIATADGDDDVEIRIARTMHLAGRYWAQAKGGKATLSIAGQPDLELDGRELVDEPDGDHDLAITATVPADGGTKLVLVSVRAIEPPRPYLAPPPETSPIH
jgi:hypothetical protein